MLYTKKEMIDTVIGAVIIALIIGIFIGASFFLTGFVRITYRPVKLGTQTVVQEKSQVYQVTVYNLFGRIVARFKGGVAFWNKPELIERVFIARFKPGSTVYIYRVYAPTGEYKQGKILVGSNPDPGK